MLARLTLKHSGTDIAVTSILTNTSAMSAMSSLAVVQRSLAKTESQITTGERVATAQDNPAYWSIATSMKSRVGQLQAVNDGLDITSSLLAVTTDGLGRILKAMQNISKDVVQAKTSGIDLRTLQDDVAQNQGAIADAANEATFSGQNLLNRDWAQTAVVNETSQYAGNTFLSGSGTETYTWSDGQGSSYQTQDAFTLTDATTRDYTSIGTLPLNPMKSTPVITGVSDDGSLQTSYLDQGDINVFGGFSAPVDVLNEVPPQYDEDINDAISNSDPNVGPRGAVETYGYAYQGRNYDNPYYNERSAVDSELVDTHTFVGQHVASTTNPGYYDDPSISPARYYKSYDGSGTATIHPYFSIMSLDLTNQVEHLVDGTTQPYVLTPDDLDKVAGMVTDNINRVTLAMAEVGSEQNLVDGSKQGNTAIMDALTSGIGSLVDADMNQASTRLQALQTQQSLGVQALGIANQNSQVIMKLFGG